MFARMFVGTCEHVGVCMCVFRCMCARARICVVCLHV